MKEANNYEKEGIREEVEALLSFIYLYFHLIHG